MKRSEINATIKKMEALLDECRFKTTAKATSILWDLH